MSFKSIWICAQEFAQLKPIDVYHKQIAEVELETEHKVRYEMRCNCLYEEICTLSGGTDEALFYDYNTFIFMS